MNQENNNFNNQFNYNQSVGQVNKENKKSGIKNFLFYELFNFIFGIIVPVVVILLDYVFMKGETTASVLEVIIIILELIIYATLKEFLTVTVAVKTSHSKYLMSKFVFILNSLSIVVATFILFKQGTNSIGFYITFYLGFIVCKIISYILTKKIVLKEKINFKWILLASTLSYVIITTLIFLGIHPTGFNKILYKTFGPKEFSSKELKIELIDYYNSNTYDKELTYTHKFTEKELEKLDSLNVNFNITDEDLSKLPNLKTLYLDNINIESIEFSKNLKLLWVEIKNSKINNLNITSDNIKHLYLESTKIDKFSVSNKTIQKIEADGVTIKNLNIENTKELTEFEMENSSIENAVFNNDFAIAKSSKNYFNIDKVENLEFKSISYLESILSDSKFVFKKLTIQDNKKMYLEDNSYLKLNYCTLGVPEGTKVKDLVLENMTAVVTDYYHDLIGCDDSGVCSYSSEQKSKVQTQDSVLADEIELYDNNNLILKLNINNYE